MIGSTKDLVKYRLSRAWETFDDAKILAGHAKWNSTINRLYYAAYYAVTALLLNSDIASSTHSGTKSLFSENFIKNELIPIEFGKIYSQLFTWRQKGDYDDLFDFDQDKVLPYFEPVEQLIEIVEKMLTE
jgi:uncharacterized protein (UPF0332 family)